MEKQITAMKTPTSAQLFVHKLLNDLNKCDAILADFEIEFRKDAGNALSWSDKVFDIAAKKIEIRNVLVSLLSCKDMPAITEVDIVTPSEERMALVTNEKLEYVRSNLMQLVCNAAKYPARSSSFASNAMSASTLSAQAAMLYVIANHID